MFPIGGVRILRVVKLQQVYYINSFFFNKPTFLVSSYPKELLKVVKKNHGSTAVSGGWMANLALLPLQNAMANGWHVMSLVRVAWSRPSPH